MSASFSEIYKQYHDKIFRVCLGFVNDPEKAKDLTQETFIAVWQNLGTFRKESSMGTWIYRIATNKCLRLIQKDKSSKAVMLPTQLSDSSPEEKLQGKIIFLRKLIAELPEIDRIIITLFMENVPQEEIASITGITHANVRVKVHRIKERLLRKFKENGKVLTN